MFYFYVLQSKINNKKYKGQTGDIDKRLKYHNSGKVASTRDNAPFEVIYTEAFLTRKEAVEREKYYKTYTGGKKLKKILNNRG